MMMPNMLRTVILAEGLLGRGPNIYQDEKELDASSLKKLQVTLQG